MDKETQKKVDEMLKRMNEGRKNKTDSKPMPKGKADYPIGTNDAL